MAMLIPIHPFPLMSVSGGGGGVKLKQFEQNFTVILYAKNKYPIPAFKYILALSLFP